MYGEGGSNSCTVDRCSWEAALFMKQRSCAISVQNKHRCYHSTSVVMSPLFVLLDLGWFELKRLDNLLQRAIASKRGHFVLDLL